MAEPSYSLTEAARLLGVSVPTARRMVSDGELSSFRTPGGHVRVTSESLGRLREGGGKEVRRPGPSPVLTNRRERVEELSLEAQELRAQRELNKLRKEAAEEAERDRQEVLAREREQRLAEEKHARLEQEQERQQQEAERIEGEAERHREWKNAILAAVPKLIPRDCPAEFHDNVYCEVEQVLDESSRPEYDHIIRNRIASAVERGLYLWRRQKAIQKAIHEAEDCLPVWARLSWGPSSWQIKFRRMARENIRKLDVDASPEEIQGAAMEASRIVAREFEQARAAEQRKQDQEAEQQNQASKIQRGLAHVSWYLRQLEEDDEFEFDDRDWLTRKLEKRIRPELLKEVQADPDLDYRDVEETVKGLVDEFLPDFVDED